MTERVRIELSETPSAEDREAVGRWVRRVAEKNAGPSGYTRFALLLRGETSGKVLGGALVEVLYGWLYLELLGVPEHIRGQQLGSRLLEAVEEQARARNCVGVWLNCFSFHAPDFYRKNGYEVFAQLENPLAGHTNFFFRKQW